MSELNMNWEILANKDYAFLTENPLLNNNIILLTLGGSHAYGTNNENSDIDVRGVMFNPMSTLLGNGNFEQFEDKKTDTTVYGLNKYVGLLMNCNPNVIESLGCKPDHYIILTKEGQQLLNNRKMFLSRRAINSFGGYANSQLRRLQNALARDSYPQAEKEKHILGSITHAMDSIVQRYHEIDGKPINYSFNKDDGALVHAMKEYNARMLNMEHFKKFEYGSICLYVDKSERDDMDAEVYMNAILHHYPLRDYRSIWNELNTIVKDYEKLGKRNTKKDDLHLNKHAMHLVRLYLMCIDILTKEEIITYRSEEHDLLMDIRNGKFQKEDGGYRPEFFEMIDDLEKKMEDAAENTSLPAMPDRNAVEEMLIEMNKQYILRLEKE